MDWRLAERIACEWLQSNGFTDAAVTASGADGGVDVVSSSLVAQVKAHSKPVGRPPIQNIHGIAVSSGRCSAVFSTSGYSPQALDWATGNGVALLTIRDDGTVVPANAAGHSLSGSPRPGGPFRRDPRRGNEAERKRLRTAARRGGARITKKSAGDLLGLLRPHEDLYVSATVKGFTPRFLMITSSSVMLVSDRRRPVSWPLGTVYGAELRRGRLRFVVNGQQHEFKVRTQTPGQEVLARLGVGSLAPTAQPSRSNPVRQGPDRSGVSHASKRTDATSNTVASSSAPVNSPSPTTTYLSTLIEKWASLSRVGVHAAADRARQRVVDYRYNRLDASEPEPPPHPLPSTGRDSSWPPPTPADDPDNWF